MRGYLPKALAKEVRGARALFLLTVAGVALGVASVLSIQILNRSALGAFAGSVRAVSGAADLTVLGWTGALDEALLPEVLGVTGVRAAVPLYRVEVAVEGRPGQGLEIVGADLLAPVRVPWALPRGGLAGALGEVGWVALSPAYARELGVAVGDRLAVSSGSRRVELRVGALVDLQRASPLASRRLAVMDLSQAQGLLGVRGRIHQIDVVAAEGVRPADLAARLQARLGDRARVTTPEARAVEAAGLLAAFRLNLTALSLVSLLVGGFLVYASVQASLVRRREELGVLRALGATRGQVAGLVLAEVAVLGLAGTALGIPFGWLAARANVGAVSGTIRNLYLLEGIERIAITPGLLVLGAVTGVGGAIAGAVLPALDASRRDPRALLASLTLEERTGAAAGRMLVGGLAALALSAVAYAALRGRWPPAGFGVAVGILAAVPLAAPAAMRLVAGLGRARRLGVGYGLRTLGTRLTTTAVAAGALAVAVSMLVGVTIMVASFRDTVERWLDVTLRADVYVTTPSWRRAQAEATLSPHVLATLRTTPGVVAVDTLRRIQGYAGDRRISITGIDARLPIQDPRVALVAGDPDAALRALAAGGAVLVSEPLARKAGLRAGGEIALRGREGQLRFPIAGIFRDYGNEAGAVLMDRLTFARAFGPGPPSNAALYLAAGVDAERTVQQLRDALAGDAVLVRSNRTLRGEVLAIFEQTFAVTRLLQAMGLVIAVAGITLSLLVLARERAGELALYRALGATRRQLFAVFVGRGLGVGVLGLALGTMGGAGLALVLVEIVNPDWFGWTLGVALPWGALAAQAAAILLAAALASVYPALRASVTPAAELSRDAL